ncbi:MAG TPA: hypothetical protein VGB14_02205 [Acidimicrobiales bacterium]|jgi:hypothetical protein
MLGPRALAATAAGALFATTILAAAPAATAGPSPAAASGGGTTSGDFDGDGYDDLAVGAPGETFGSLAVGAGNVTVTFGGPRGLDPGRSQIVREDLAGVPGYPQRDDRFGSSVAAGDFDRDGFDDLAVGVPGERSTEPSAGSVAVVFGSPGGLSGGRAVILQQGVAPVGGALEGDDRFGWSVAAGDLDGDGYDDLAIGAPGEDVGETEDAGNLTVLLGGPTGLGSAVTIREGLDGTPGTPSADEQLGDAVAIGDLDGDGYDDLAAGAPLEEVQGLVWQGAVLVVRGSATGPDLRAGEMFGTGAAPYAFSEFGTALAAGDLDGDGLDDLAVGAPGQDGPGSVYVVFGTRDGGPSDPIELDQRAVGQLEEYDDRFGASVAIVPFRGLADPVLAVGVPHEDVGSITDAGLVVLVARPFRGDQTSEARHQGSIAGATEPGDLFGSAIAGGDYDGDGRGDLVVGAPGEAVGDVDGAGNATVLTGSGAGTALNQGTVGGNVEPGDGFGGSAA